MYIYIFLLIYKKVRLIFKSLKSSTQKVKIRASDLEGVTDLLKWESCLELDLGKKESARKKKRSYRKDKKWVPRKKRASIKSVPDL